MAEQIVIGSIEQIPPGEGRAFRVAATNVAVFRTHADEVYVTQAECPHRRGPLADGLLGGTTIVCPLHDRAFDVKTGEGVGGECARLRIFPVALTDEHLMVISV